MTQLGTKKSRRGCNHCKRRRVKCDERIPCGNCARRDEACNLLYPPSTDVSCNGSIPHDSTDWLQDLELMHHFSKYTSYTQLGGGDQAPRVWGEYVPGEALKHAFLMHGILGIAAVHIAAEAPPGPIREKYLQIYSKHQAIALDPSRSVVANVNTNITIALFAVSIVTSLSTLAQSHIRAQSRPEPRFIDIDELVACLALTRGSREIVSASMETLLQSPMNPMFTCFESYSSIRVRLPKQLVDAVSGLQRMLSEHCEEKSKHLVCSTAVMFLEQAFRNVVFFVSNDSLIMGHVWRWPAMVDTEFIQLIKSRYQPALIITSFFVCCCQFLRGEWYIRDWGRYAFEGLSNAVDDDFQQYLAWPRNQFATDCAAFRQGDATIEHQDDGLNDNQEGEQYLFKLLTGIKSTRTLTPTPADSSVE